MKRPTRPLVLFAAVLTLLLGAAGMTALLVPVPTDAAIMSAGGATIAATECQARLTEASHGFSVTLASLSSAASATVSQRCDAYRAHVVALSSARDVYATCLTGFARSDQVDQIDLATRDWRSAIAVSCSD
jgi:hypothetical protein